MFRVRHPAGANGSEARPFAAIRERLRHRLVSARPWVYRRRALLGHVHLRRPIQPRPPELGALSISRVRVGSAEPQTRNRGQWRATLRVPLPLEAVAHDEARRVRPRASDAHRLAFRRVGPAWRHLVAHLEGGEDLLDEDPHIACPDVCTRRNHSSQREAERLCRGRHRILLRLPKRTRQLDWWRPQRATYATLQGLGPPERLVLETLHGLTAGRFVGTRARLRRWP
mmetsp:Transcript_64091/g.178136  ORF Transcript_64091/g.178136 Transcript_64091/m.178136 type:complete len:227 (+) Transcript_64091:187-867(+)